MRQIRYLVGWGHQFVTPCLTQLAFPQVYIGLYSLPWRRWLFIYKWGCVSSFLLYLSELSFVIGITAEKINTATDNIYPQFLVGLPCKPGSPVKIPVIALGAIFFFLVIWGRLLSLAGACRWVMKKNCRITSFFVAHGNLAWAFPMLVGDIKHQQNQTSIHSQWSNLWPNCMDLYDSHLQEHWQAFYSSLTQCLPPKWAPGEPPPKAPFVTSQRKPLFFFFFFFFSSPTELCFPALALTRGFFPPCLHTQRKIFSCGGKNAPHLNLWHPQEENWLSVTPVVRVSFFPFL